MILSHVLAFLESNYLSYVRLYEVLNNTTAIRRTIRKENVSQAGIYHWENMLNNSGYTGRAKDLGSRLDSYFTPSNLRRSADTRGSVISNTLLKHGIGNFRLFILEVLPSYNDDNISHRELLSFLDG